MIAASKDGSFAIAVNVRSGSYPLLNPLQPEPRTGPKIYVAKFSPADTLAFATYYGASNPAPLTASGEDYVRAIQMDRDGAVLLAGHTTSPDFPGVQAQNFQPAAFVMRLSADGRRVDWTVTLASPGIAAALAVSPTGAVWAAGLTWSPGFRVSADAYWRDLMFIPDGGRLAGFLVRLNPRTGEVERSSYLGPSAVSTILSLRLTAAGAPQLLFSAYPGMPELAPSNVPVQGLDTNYILRLDSEASRSTWAAYTDASLASPFDEQFLLLGKSLPVVSNRVEWSGFESSVDRPTVFIWNPGHPETTAQPASPLPDPVYSVFSHPEDPQLLLALSSGGLYRSENGGLHWDRYHDLSQYYLTHFVIPSWDPSTWLAIGGLRTEGANRRHILLRSLDSGNLWQPLALPEWRDGSLVASPKETGVLYLLQPRNSGSALLTRSDDNGSTWTSVQAFSHNYFADLLPDPEEAGRLLLREYREPCMMKFCTSPAGKDRLWESTDGGASFRETLGPPDGYLGGRLFQSPVDPDRLYLGTLSSRDHGRTWHPTSTRNVYFIDGAGHLYSLDTYHNPNPYLRSNDDGVTWSRLPIPAGLPTPWFVLRPTSLRNQPMFLGVGTPTVAGLAVSESPGVLSEMTLVDSPWSVTLADAHASAGGRIGALFSVPYYGLVADCPDRPAFQFRTGTLAAGLGAPLLGFCGLTQLAPGPEGSWLFVSQDASPNRPAVQHTLRITRLDGH